MGVIPFPKPTRPGPSFFDAARAEANGHIEAAIEIYEECLWENQDPRAAINLGTIAYDRRQFVQAEAYFRRGTQLAPGWTLAWFNLANVLDELGQRLEAVECYEASLKLDPHHEDAHYNLAQLLTRLGEPRRALRHWKAYLKRDRSDGAYAIHARTVVDETMKAEKMQLVRHAPRMER